MSDATTPDQSQHVLRKRTRRTARNPDSQLTIRWFTPRGRAALADLVEDILHGEGRHVADAVVELRRPGVAEGLVDLRGIDLRGVELANAQLSKVDLSGARLAGINFRRANFKGSVLERAVLRGAKLTGSNLEGADLRGSDLREADLSDCNLEDAQLKGAKMRGADVKRAWAKGVDFSEAFADGVDMSRIRRKPHRAPRSTVRLREGIGAPPGSEPVPATQRFRKRPTPPKMTARRARPQPQLARPAAANDLDAALAQLLLRRGEVERIVVTMNGRELELYVKDGQAALRAA